MFDKIIKQSKHPEVELETKWTVPKESSYWQGRSGKIWLAIFTLALVFSFIGGLLMLQTSNNSGGTPTPTIEPTPAPQALPTPVPTPEIQAELSFSQYAISVLNGSGLSGEAGRARSILETADFTVSSVGNANRVNYQETLIQAKENVSSEYLDQLRAVLESVYILSEVTVLDTSQEADVIITIGRLKK